MKMMDHGHVCLKLVALAALVSACGATDPGTSVASSESALVVGPVELAVDAATLRAAPAYWANLQTNDGPVSIPYKAVGAYGIVDGDIILGDLTALQQYSDEEGAGRLSVGARWPGGVVVYTIDPALPNQARVTNAIAAWQANTGIRFRQRTNEADYVRFQSGGGCSSYVGRIGGAQTISLAAGCSTGNAIHEIGHTVGLWHEQSRVDRDGHVVIHAENVQDGSIHNFNTYVQNGSDGVDISEYDFGSIMHYPLDAFSKNGQNTIEIRHPETVTATVGQREALGAGDRLTVGLLYCREPGYPCAIQFD